MARTTLTDLAKAAGVARSTASMALANDVRIASATRLRLQQLARDLGYRPDPFVSQVAARRWQPEPGFGRSCLAYIYSSEGRDKYRYELGDRFIAQGVRDEARARGYQLNAFDLANYPDARELGRVLYNRGITGLVFAPLFEPLREPTFEWQHFSVVGCAQGYFDVPCERVVSNKFHQMRLALARVAALGYTRAGIVLLEHDHSIEDDDLRMAAILLQRHRRKQKLRIVSVMRMPVGEHRAIKILRWYEKHRPEVVIGFSQGEFECLARGDPPFGCYRCPEDFAFVSLHIESNDGFFSGLLLEGHLIGARAVQLVDLLIRGNVRGLPVSPPMHVVDPPWIDGKTCPPADQRIATARSA